MFIGEDRGEGVIVEDTGALTTVSLGGEVMFVDAGRGEATEGFVSAFDPNAPLVRDVDDVSFEVVPPYMRLVFVPVDGENILP